MSKAQDRRSGYGYPRESTERTEHVENCWTELSESLKPLFEAQTGPFRWYSKDAKVVYHRGERDGKKYVALVPYGLDNCYDEEYDWHWEIYLYEDGTWEIT